MLVRPASAPRFVSRKWQRRVRYRSLASVFIGAIPKMKEMGLSLAWPSESCPSWGPGSRIAGNACNRIGTASHYIPMKGPVFKCS